MRNKPIRLDLTVIALSLIIMAAVLPTLCRAANQTYASLPPFISSDTKANVVFVVDFSGSMSWQAYNGNYSSAIDYYGYFDPDEYYAYDNAKDYWYVDTGTAHANKEPGDVDSLSGNFLNYIVTSRVDAVLKSLIGGKADCPNGKDYCLLEPQGSSRTIRDTNLNVSCALSTSSGDRLMSISDYLVSSSIGTFSDRYARVKIDSDDRHGLIQDNFSKLRLTFMAYASGSNNTAEEGLIKYGFHEDDQDDLVSAIQNTTPSNTTHTGEALREAYYYLTQDAAAQSYNSSYIADGTEVDPYYQKRDDGTLEAAWCRESYVILISDGEWNGSIDPDEWAQKLHIEDLRQEIVSGTDLFPGDQTADVYSIFAFSTSQTGEQSMKTVAAFGSYDDLTGGTDGTPYTFSKGDNSKNNSFPRTNCDPGGTYNNACDEWDSRDNDGSPDAFFYASDGQAVSDALSAIFESIRQGTASGSAVTALTSRVSTGNVVAQAAFYPEKDFGGGKKVAWTGDVFGEWYLNGYIPDASGTDKLVQNIREDTDGDYSLQVEDDRIIEYIINNKELTINAYDSNEYGIPADATVDQVYHSIEEMKNLFDCGEQLRTRDPDDRTIYGVDENDDLTEFTVANKEKFDTLLGSTAAEYPDCLLSSGSPDYENLIKYTRGEPVATCRSRATDSTSNENVWKIGDIIYSSPSIVEYDDYALIYAGSNNGMLHAFHMGFIKNIGKTLNPAKLCDDSSASTCTHDIIGKEAWAFVPKDAMPYLRYMANPDYNHIYTVDLKPFIVNMGSRIILIGGMRFGGGTDATDADASNPPSDTGTVGRSAYYALDITDPLNPKYLWRYAPDGMGFSYSGPAYVKRKDSSGKWHYFIMFASGPTTYEGRSTQDLRIFTVDLLTGDEKDVFGDVPSELGINNAFGGRLFTNGLDVDEDGQTDYIFLGYTDKANGEYNKMTGGVIKIWTGSDVPKNNWDYNKTYLRFNGSPITAPIKVMDCFPDQLSFPFLYFGTGRYFVSNDETQDTNSDVNYLYGVPFNYGADNTPIKGGTSINSSNNASAVTCATLDNINTNPLKAAWHIPLEEAGGNYLRERCYSDPSVTEYNIVFFDTARPTDVVCECGGQARSWVVNCASGMAITDVICTGTDKYVVDEKIQFTYLIQRSGGDIQQYGEDEFDQNDDRTTSWEEGVPSEQGGLPTFPSGSMLGTILYWKQW